jgi:hypothetical protein
LIAIEVAGQKPRSRRTNAVLLDIFDGPLLEKWVLRQPQVVIGSEVDQMPIVNGDLDRSNGSTRSQPAELFVMLALKKRRLIRLRVAAEKHWIFHRYIYVIRYRNHRLSILLMFWWM